MSALPADCHRYEKQYDGMGQIAVCEVCIVRRTFDDVGRQYGSEKSQVSHSSVVTINVTPNCSRW